MRTEKLRSSPLMMRVTWCCGRPLCSSTPSSMGANSGTASASGRPMSLEPSRARSFSAERHLLGCADQATDGGHELPGKPQPDPDGGQQGRERDHEIHEPVGELQAASHLPQALVAAHAGFRPLQMLDDLGVYAAGDVEE